MTTSQTMRVGLARNTSVDVVLSFINRCTTAYNDMGGPPTFCTNDSSVTGVFMKRSLFVVCAEDGRPQIGLREQCV